MPSGSPGPRRSEDNNPNPWGERQLGRTQRARKDRGGPAGKWQGGHLSASQASCRDSQTNAPGPLARVGAELSPAVRYGQRATSPPPWTPPIPEPLLPTHPRPPYRPAHTYVESFLVQKRPPGHSSWSCTARPRLLLIWASCKSDSASSRSA